MGEVIKMNMRFFVIFKVCFYKFGFKIEFYFVEESCFFDDIFKFI